MIGFLDSGLGGLHTMRYFQELYPQYKYEFFGDFENAPYGQKDPKWIKEQTFRNLENLFDKGCKIVILACNTAASFAIRDRQTAYPKKKVLSVTIPGIEKCIQIGYKKVSVIATPNTVKSGIYPELFDRLYSKNTKESSSLKGTRQSITKNIKLAGLPNRQTGRYNTKRVRQSGKRVFNIQQISASELVPLIEQGKTSKKEIGQIIKAYCDQVDPDSECLILGCTHFPIIIDIWKNYIDTDIIDPGYESAIIFGRYLENHLEIKDQLSIFN